MKEREWWDVSIDIDAKRGRQKTHNDAGGGYDLFYFWLALAAHWNPMVWKSLPVNLIHRIH